MTPALFLLSQDEFCLCLFTHCSVQTSSAVSRLSGAGRSQGTRSPASSTQLGASLLKFKPLRNIILQQRPGCVKAGSDCGHHPSSLLPGQKSLFDTSASVTGEKLNKLPGYVWLFLPPRKGEPLAVGTAWPVTGTHFHKAICLSLCQTWLFPAAGMFEAEAQCPEQPLTEEHKHGAKGKGTTLVLAQAWICLTPGSSMDVSDLQPCGTCLYNPSLLCAICFPFGRLAIRDSMLKLVSP